MTTINKKVQWRLFYLCLFFAFVTDGAYAGIIPGTLTGQYFTVLSDPDFNQHQLTSLIVQSQLGLDGLPVFASGSVPVNDLTTVNVNGATANGEITWWSPSLNSNVLPPTTPTGTFNGAFIDSTMFAPEPGVGSGPSPNTLGFLTAHFTATIISANSATPLYMFLGADDDAFVYIDGNIISQLGGVHGYTNPTASLLTLAQGSHTLDVFYADREQSQARLTFALSDTPFLLVPEPSIALLIGTGLLALLIVDRRISTQKA